jgi:hypothetical protein
MPNGQPADRRSLTVRKVGAELNRAIEIRRALAEHADDPALILDTIEGETDFAEACCVVFEETLEDQTLLAGLETTIAALQVRKGRIEKSIADRRNIILMAMERGGIQTIKGPLATLSSGTTPATTIVSDEALIPARFWKPSDPKLDRAALAEALKAGETVPGATLSNGGVNLRIRMK